MTWQTATDNAGCRDCSLSQSYCYLIVLVCQSSFRPVTLWTLLDEDLKLAVQLHHPTSVYEALTPNVLACFASLWNLFGSVEGHTWCLLRYCQWLSPRALMAWSCTMLSGLQWFATDCDILLCLWLLET